MNMLDMDILLRLQPRLGVLHDIDIGRVVSDPPDQNAVLRSMIVTNGLTWGLGVSLMRTIF